MFIPYTKIMNTKKLLLHNLVLFILPVITLIGIIQIKNSQQVVEAVSSDIVISEVQIAGATANDEFVELYNPTQNSIDLSGWRLSRKSSSISGTITNLVSSLSGTIQPHGFFLIANPNFTGSMTPDLYYSATTSGIAANNTVILYRDNGLTIVDKVGMGTAEDVESAAAILPESLQSIERKPHQHATYESMNNGTDILAGNGFDSDNNFQDFVLRINPEPQNSQSPIEPEIQTVTPTELPSPTSTIVATIAPTETPLPTPTQIPSPTLMPTHTPIPTLTPTLSPTPTIFITPTNTPTPTEIITPSPFPTQTPMATVTPTYTPTIIPTTTVSPTQFPIPSLTPQPTLSITPTPTVSYPFPLLTLQCTWKEKTVRTFWITYSFKFPQCSLVRIENK